MITGVDFSHNNGVPPYQKIADAGYKFAILKATEGLTFKDPMFRANLAGFKAVGIQTGAYHFYVPGDDPTKQALFFLAQLLKTDYPLILAGDFEQTPGWDALQNESIGEALQEFLDTVQTGSGGKPLVYSDAAFIEQYLTTFPMGNYGLWLAGGKASAQFANYAILQTEGLVSFMPGLVDTNVFTSDDLSSILSPVVTRT